MLYNLLVLLISCSVKVGRKVGQPRDTNLLWMQQQPSGDYQSCHLTLWHC